MPAVTPIYGWPFQSLTDPPDGASLGEDLALAIEQTVSMIGAVVAGLSTAVTSLTTRVNNIEVAANLIQTSAQTLTTSVDTAVQFNDETLDSAGGHDNVTNNTRYTAPVTGWYRTGGAVGFAANVTGIRVTRLRLNGTTIVPGSIINLNATTAFFSVIPIRDMLVFMNAGEYIEVLATQTSGINLSTEVTDVGARSSFSIDFIRPTV